MGSVLTFRDEILNRAPIWLRNGTAGRILYAIGLHADGFADAVAAGLKSRFPNYYSAESLPFIGRERRIRRGRTESNETYAGRLNRWFDAHRYRGNPYEMLRQIHAHFAPANFQVELVYRSGRRFTMDAAGAVTRDDITWAPDAMPEKWARWWLFYSWPDPIAVSDGLWGDPGLWGDGGVWGSGQSPTLIQELTLTPGDWNAAHALGKVVLMPPTTDVAGYPDTDDWAPAGSVGDERLEVRV